MDVNPHSIANEVLSKGCRAAVEATYSYASDSSNSHQITAQCGDRGFQSEQAVNPMNKVLYSLVEQHKTSVARLCAAMCIGCPNRNTAK